MAILFRLQQSLGELMLSNNNTRHVPVLQPKHRSKRQHRWITSLKPAPERIVAGSWQSKKSVGELSKRVSIFNIILEFKKTPRFFLLLLFYKLSKHFHSSLNIHFPPPTFMASRHRSSICFLPLLAASSLFSSISCVVGISGFQYPGGDGCL